MKNNISNNQDEVWDIVELIDELNAKKLEIMDEGSCKAKIWQRIEPHVRTEACGDFKEMAAEVSGVPEISADLVTKARIKEMVMEYVENVRITGRVFFVRKSFWAAATLLAVLFFNFYPKMPFFPHADAEKLTYVEVEQGEVEIVRGDKVFEVFDYMVLNEGDSVRVADGSLAQIYFLDDSRVAMAPGSEVSLHKLYMDEENEAVTKVEILVEEGNVWAQVINLTGDEDYFSVLTREGEFRVDRAADLNVEVEDEEVSVQVVKNLASFVVPSAYGDREGILGEGMQIYIFEDELVIEEGDCDDVWCEYNLVEGEKHLDSVINYYITQSSDRADLLTKSPLQSLKKFQETMGQAVGIEPELEISDASDALVEAEQLITDGETEEAEVKIEEYLSIMEEIVSEEEPAEEEVQAQIDEATKALSVKIAENEDLSVIQEALDEAEETTKQDEGEKTVTRVNNASNKLSTVNSLIDTGSYVDALEQLEVYREEVYEVVVDITEVPQEDRATVVGEFLDNKIEDLHLLKIITTKLSDLGEFVDPEFAEELSETKQQTLFEINALVVSMKERAIGTISDFLSQVQADESVQVQVLSSLNQDFPLDLDIMKKINDIEEVYYSEDGVVFLVSE